MTDDESGRRCPECGREVSDRTIPPPPSLFHWRRLIWLTIPLAIAVFAFWLKHGEDTRRTSSGTMLPILVEPAVDVDLLRKVADGERDFALAAAVMRAAHRTLAPRSMPGTARLEVGFVEPQGRAFTNTSFGWPSSWYSRSEVRLYEDGASRAALVPATTDDTLQPLGLHEFPRDFPRVPARDRWMFEDWATLRLQPPPEETGGAFVTTTWRFRGMLASFGYVILAWLATGFGIFLFNRFRSKERHRPYLRLRFMLTALAAIAVLIAGWRSSETMERLGVRPPTPEYVVGRFGGPRTTTWRGFLPPGGEMITPEELARLATAPNGNAELAQRILAGFEGTDQLPTGDRGLAALFRPEATMQGDWTRWNEKFPLLTRNESIYERHAAFDGPEHVAFDTPGFAMDFSLTSVSWMWAPEDPAEPVIRWTLSLVSLGSAFVWLALLWLAVWLIGCAVPAIIMRRRVRRGRCGGCGYILVPAG